MLCSYCLFLPFCFRRCSPLGNFRHVYQSGIPNASEATNEDLLESRKDFRCAPFSIWLALFIALAGLATSSCKAVASGLAVREGLVVKSDSPCLRFGLALAYLLVLSFERDPIRSPSLPATLTEGLFFTSRHDERKLLDRPLLFSSYRLCMAWRVRGGEKSQYSDSPCCRTEGRLGSSVTAFVLAARFGYVFNALFNPQSPSAFDFINVAAAIWNWMRLSARFWFCSPLHSN